MLFIELYIYFTLISKLQYCKFLLFQLINHFTLSMRIEYFSFIALSKILHESHYFHNNSFIQIVQKHLEACE
jgi:hypothetical protein